MEDLKVGYISFKVLHLSQNEKFSLFCENCLLLFTAYNKYLRGNIGDYLG